MEKLTFQKSALTASAARRMIEAAEREAVTLGFAISVSILDESGNEKAFSRMDGAPLISISASQQKAKTAIGFGIPTGDDWYQFIKDDPILFAGAQQLKDFILLGGGLPAVINNEVVGAIGVSGGHYKNDELCAKAGLRALFDA